QIAAMDAEAVIPSKRNRKVAIPHDALIYKHRNQIERCFGRLKHFRRFATRYDRRIIHFTGFVHLAAAMIWLR
ncbi:transposase, partial [uncultured Sphingomonas sp.]